MITRAVEQKAIYDGEVAEGEKRLQLLSEDASPAPPAPSMSSSSCGVAASDRRFDARAAVDARERRVKARYGLRGVRVGEASNPGPSQARAMFHDTKTAADCAIASLDRELTSPDTSDDEPMFRPAGSRNVVPKVANARFPGQSRHRRGLPDSRSITPTSPTVPGASGELQLMERGRVADAVPMMDMTVNDSDWSPRSRGTGLPPSGITIQVL